MTFPKSPHLVEGKGEQVGILTLWTKKEHVLAHVPKDLYVVTSQLYSRDEGVSNLLRSLLSHKEVRDLVLVGADLNGCADALLAVWSNGVENGSVIGAPGYVDPEIPREAVDRVREHVQLHDQRSTPVRELATYIKTIPKKPSWGEPEEFPQAKITPPEFFPFANQHSIRQASAPLALQEAAARQRRVGALHNAQLQVTQPEHTNLPEEASSNDGHSFQQVHQATLTQAQELLTNLGAQKTATLTIDVLTPDNLTQELSQHTVSRRFTGDPASNIRIRLRDGEIEVTHLSPDGKRLEVFSSTSGEELHRKLVEEFRVADMSHASYLGYELGKAEYALKMGEWYEQDQPLFFKDKQ